MYVAAYIALLVALLFSLGAGCFALLQLWESRSDYLPLIRKASWIISLCLLFASAALLHALFWQDLRLEYVASYTDATLPLFYRLTAFWAGQPGSLLFWALISSLCGSAWAFRREASLPDGRSCLWFWCMFYTIMAFFCLLLTGWSNPFILLNPAPLEGQGLNPLLQNPGMIIHPPLLFMGYAFFTVPACLALANLLTPAPSGWRWQQASRWLIMPGWILLTAGIIIGAWWAYMELGWGGYWGWDPVENASLLPWLSATAALHVLAIQNASGKLGRFSVFLMALTLILAFFATYLTRSGVIQSVHAFGDGGVGTPLLVFTIVAFLLALFIPLTAAGNSSPLASPFSREGAILLAVWLLLALILIILLATIWPVITQWLKGVPVGLDASFYNRVCLPLASCLILLLAFCQWVGWTGGFAGNNAILKLIAISGVFIASAIAIWASGYRLPLPLLASSAALAAICSSSARIINGGFWRNPRAISAFGAHFGLGIIAIGVAFSGPYSTERELLLSPNSRETVGPYVVELEKITEGDGRGYVFLRADLNIRLNGEPVGKLAPERRIYSKFGAMQFSEVDVISTLGEDVYASLLGMDEEHSVLVKISLEPLVNWIWIGGAIMCLIPWFGVWRRKKLIAGAFRD